LKLCKKKSDECERNPTTTNRGLLVDHGNLELLVIEADVSNFGPRKAEARRDLVVVLVNVHAKVVHAEPELGAFLVGDLEKRHAVHFEVLRNVEIVGDGLVAWNAFELVPCVLDPVLPLLHSQRMLSEHTLGELLGRVESAHAVRGGVEVPKARLGALRGKEHAELSRAVELVFHDDIANLQPEQATQGHGCELLVDDLGVKLGAEVHLQRVLLLHVLLGNLLLRLEKGQKSLAVLVLKAE